MRLQTRIGSREYYNPLSGLTPERIRAWEYQSDRGQLSELQWFFKYMEEADSTITAAISRRLSFVDSLDWQIRTMENATDPVLAAQQAAYLEYAYNRIRNLREAARALNLAQFRGFAILEKIPEGYGNLIAELKPIPQWFWTRRGLTGEYRFNPEARADAKDGTPIVRSQLVIMENPRPINRAISRHFYSKHLALADWDDALDTSANPSAFIVAPPGASDEKLAQYDAIAQRLRSNGRGVLPNGSDLKQFDTMNRARLPFVDRIDYCDRQIVLAATGGQLTMLAESGSGTLAGTAHEDTLVGLARADAAAISEVLQRDIDTHLLNARFPKQPHLAYFSFDVPVKEDVAGILAAVGNLSWAGYSVEQKQLEEKTGLKLKPLQQQAPAQ